MIKLRVKELLHEKDLSQKDLAKHLDMTETGISKAIGSNGNLSLKKLEGIAKFLNVDFLELFTPANSDTKGYIEHKGKVYKIESLNDLEELIKTAKQSQ